MPHNSNFIAALGVLFLLPSIPLTAADDPFTLISRTEATPLLELFTSEGCSSCPPAEAWVSTLLQDPGLWRDFVPVVWHVNYWDNLGWPDPFADTKYTERQRLYSALWASSSVYTPGFVWQGREWRNWHGPKPATPASNPGALSVKIEKGLLNVQFPGTGPWEVHVAILGSGVVSKVKAGENAGRLLQHDFTVLAHGMEPVKTLPAVFPLPQALLNVGSRPKTALVIWLQRPGDPTPVQAVGGWMPLVRGVK